MGRITTGVDKLLHLLEEKGKHSIMQAAAQLGVEKEVVEEWVELLEAEKLVTVSYKFSKQYVELRDASAEPIIIDNLKKVTSEQEAFRRKIDVALREIDKETSGFRELKHHYQEVQRGIKDELHTVRLQMEELKRFDKLKKEITEGVEEQQKLYKKFMDEYDKAIEKYDTQYKDFVAEIVVEEKKIHTIESKIEDLQKQKKATEDLVASGIESLKQISHEVKTHLKDVESAEKRIVSIHKDLNELQKGADKKRDHFLRQLSKSVGKKREEVSLEQEQLLNSTRERVKIIQNYSVTGQKAFEDFNKLFLKKIQALDKFDDIEKERNDLVKDLEELKKKVDAFTVAGKYAQMKKQIGDIEKVVEKYTKRKNSLLHKITGLVDFIK